MTTPIWFVSLIKKAFPYRYKLARLSKFPAIGALMDKTLFNGDDLIYLPKDRVVIQQSVEQPGSTVLPSALVDHFIEKSSHRWIMNECLCRTGDNCQSYPQDLGCLFLGEAVQSINPKMGHAASKEEAHAHVQRAREMGLVHLIGRDRIDNLWLAAGPFGKLMTICNCCPCCCLFRVLPDLDVLNRSKVTRMPGVTVAVNRAECAGCGKCIREGCFVQAIEMVDHKAQISDECRGCGRCVETCPQQAIHLSIDDSDYIQKQIERISTLVDVSSTKSLPQVQVNQPVRE